NRLAADGHRERIENDLIAARRKVHAVSKDIGIEIERQLHRSARRDPRLIASDDVEIHNAGNGDVHEFRMGRCARKPTRSNSNDDLTQHVTFSSQSVKPLPLLPCYRSSSSS